VREVRGPLDHIPSFAKDDAVRTVNDHALMQEAITSGRITALEGI
jgi:hypothetical protein